jgi:threonine dehydratase
LKSKDIPELRHLLPRAAGELMFDRGSLETAAALVHAFMPATPQYAWPLLRERTGAEVFVKHENHTPTGAFKIRGGICYFDFLKRSGIKPLGVISATRGNHGQSIALAGGTAGIPVTIVVPEQNSIEKNASMRAFGADVIESGVDFDAAREKALALSETKGLHMVPSFHHELIRGVASYALELFLNVARLDTVYVPIGLGSGICGLILVRDLLQLKTQIIGVVSSQADAYAQSFEQGKLVTTASADTIADGMACRIPDPAALEIIARGAERIVRVSDLEVATAVRAYHEDTHNLVEGAGAAPLAALLQERERQRGKRIGLILTGGNIDRKNLIAILSRQ